MRFISIIKVESVNPTNGAVGINFRAVSDTGKELKIANTIDELKAAGSPQDILGKLLVVDGQFGQFCQLRKYKVLDTVTSWDEPVEDTKKK